MEADAGRPETADSFRASYPLHPEVLRTLTSSPHIAAPVRVAGLAGRNLQLVEHRVLRRLARAGIKLRAAGAARARRHAISEHLALKLGLLFRALAPMRSRANMRAVADGIDGHGHGATCGFPVPGGGAAAKTCRLAVRSDGTREPRSVAS